jgi:ribonuclease-3
VCGESLKNVALKHNFSDFLYLGKSEIIAGGEKRLATLEDSMEAMIAAIYLDGGLGAVKSFIIDNLKDDIEIATKNVGVKDYKTVLQEKLQENGEVKIKYVVTRESGPDHEKKFEVEVMCEGKPLAKGEGRSKKAAEMQAAKKALERI